VVIQKSVCISIFGLLWPERLSISAAPKYLIRQERGNLKGGRDYLNRKFRQQILFTGLVIYLPLERLTAAVGKDLSKSSLNDLDNYM
jgi:hypothetical protein